MDAFDSVPVNDGSPLHPDSLRAWFDEHTPWQAGFLSLLRAISARDTVQPLLVSWSVRQIGSIAGLLAARDTPSVFTLM